MIRTPGLVAADAAGSSMARARRPITFGRRCSKADAAGVRAWAPAGRGAATRMGPAYRLATPGFAAGSSIALVSVPGLALGLARLRLGDLEVSRSLLVDAMRAALGLQVTWMRLNGLEAAADWLGTTDNPRSACIYWVALDSVRERTLDRTSGNDLGLFVAPRERDRSALTASDLERATTAGRGMSLDDALAAAIMDLRQTDDGAIRRRTGGGRRPQNLTAREREVLQLLAAGRSTARSPRRSSSARRLPPSMSQTSRASSGRAAESRSCGLRCAPASSRLHRKSRPRPIRGMSCLARQTTSRRAGDCYRVGAH